MARPRLSYDGELYVRPVGRGIVLEGWQPCLLSRRIEPDICC